LYDGESSATTSNLGYAKNKTLILRCHGSHETHVFIFKFGDNECTIAFKSDPVDNLGFFRATKWFDYTYRFSAKFNHHIHYRWRVWTKDGMLLLLWLSQTKKG